MAAEKVLASLPLGQSFFDQVIEKPSLKVLLLFGLLVISAVSTIAREGREDVNVGPILNNSDAKQKCEKAIADFQNRNTNVEARWTGQWTSNGSTSVCGIRYISRDDWQSNSINNRPMAYHDHYSACARMNNISNGWIYDDICRDSLITDHSKLEHIIVVNEKESITTAPDSRYIFVLRSYDDLLILRRYDRSHDKIFSYSKYKVCNYDKYLDVKNKRTIKNTKNQHVRHSQLNGSYYDIEMDINENLIVKSDAWTPVWSAGELWIKKGEIISISNESGHFTPSFESLDYVKKTLNYFSIPTNNIRFYDITKKTDSESLRQLRDMCLGGEKN